MARTRTFLEAYGLSIYTYPLTILLIILFGVCTEYDPILVKGVASDAEVRTPVPTYNSNSITTYPMYMDAAAMCVMGFGFLYCFSKYYVWSGVGFNFFICGFCFLWTAICTCFINSMWEGELVKTPIELTTMMSSNLVTAAVLISFGAFYGFITPAQLVVICVLEPFFMKLNEHLVFHEFHVQDAGGSLVTHAFGAYFGIAVTAVLRIKPNKLLDEYRVTQYFSDMAAMIGCIVLWMFWPSFNGALLFNDSVLQHRVVVNTYLAICGSCVTAFATSTAINKGRLEMIEIQNATLAGGVIIGMMSSFLLAPWIALLIGCIGGCISSIGYSKIHPALENLGITDSAGVQMLHGIPGVLGTIFAAFAVLADNPNHFYSFDTQWMRKVNIEHSSGQQFGYILLALVVTLLISVVSGLITGLIIKAPIFPKLDYDEMLIDHDFWHVHGSDPRYKKKRFDEAQVLENKNAYSKEAETAQ